ncbi:unnamed protein product, partial [Mesorhabditis spiculigera]
MSTSLTATVCYLARQEAFIANNRSIHTETWDIRFCGDRIHLPPPRAQNLDEWHMLAVIRHPMERFLSGFLDKCIRQAQQPGQVHICYNCSGSLPCFLDRLYESAQRQMNYIEYEMHYKSPHQMRDSSKLIATTLNKRQSILKVAEKCRLGPGSPCLRPFVHLTPHFLTTKKKKIAVCRIAKSMSTTLAATVCYLDCDKEFIAHNRSIHTEIWDVRFCGPRIEIADSPVSANSSENINDWNMLAIIRHPLERFMSGFIDKCIMKGTVPELVHRYCYGCNGSLPCFLGRLYTSAQSYARTEHWRYIGTEGMHFFPQNWYCNFLAFPQMKVIPFLNGAIGLSRLRTEFLDFLQHANVEERQLNYIETELAYKSPHRMRETSKLVR